MNIYNFFGPDLVAQLVEHQLQVMGGPGFNPGPQHAKVVNNDCGIAPLLTRKQILG